MFRLIITVFYFSFTLFAYLPKAEDCTDSCEMEMTCCSKESSGCESESPMDCCVDEEPNLSMYDQVVPFTLQTLASQHVDIETKRINIQWPTLDLESYQWHPPPERQKVYIKFHRLLFYA